MKGYKLEFKNNEYICYSLFADIFIEDYFYELEKELIEKIKLNKKTKICFDVKVNKEQKNRFFTYFESGKLLYSFLLE